MFDRHPPATGDARPSGQAASHLSLLVETGLLLARGCSVEDIVHVSLHAGLKLSGAAFGAFFYTDPAQDGQPYRLDKPAACVPEAIAHFPLPRPPEILHETFVHARTLRSENITLDPRFGPYPPFDGLPPQTTTLRSFLAVPVPSRSGDTIGALLYGHPEPGVFPDACEPLVATVAAQAAVAIENARLSETLSHEIAQTGNARQEQRTAAERLAELLEATTDAVFLLDRGWRFTFLNRRATELIGQGRDLLGQKIWEAFPEAIGTSFYERYSQVMQGGGPADFTGFYPPLNSWYFVRAYPTAEGLAAFFQDVTVAHVTERERDETARRLRQALDAGEFGTWTWEMATDNIDFDERGARIFGTEANKPLKRSEVRERLVVPEDLSRTAPSLRDTLASGGVYNAEYRIRRDGEQRWISAHGLATFNEAGTEIIGMTGTVQDITARKTQEATLRQSEKLAATGRLAATIAHEINNPLEAVTNLIFIAKSDPSVPAPVQRLLEIADEELARVAQLAQQTLGFYRDTTRPGPIDLTAVLHGVIDLFSRKLRYKGLTCRAEIEPGLSIFGLPGEIRQVFSNLFVNAIDAAQSGEIRLRARRRSVGGVQGVSCAIMDCGTGIPASIRERLFSPFTTSKQSLGTGLGLWVTRGMVEKHGGRISYRTRTEPPTGTVFRVFLPAKFLNPNVFDTPESKHLQ